jgi:hypothetical protein
MKVVNELKAHVDSLPEPSKEEAAKEYLIVAQEKYDRCRATKVELDAAAMREALAAQVFRHYGEITTSVLEGIYDTVQKDFTSYYAYINRDDEQKFEGRLAPSVGKLAFDVDFYGRGKFPPGAYHSEGHQDGMGLCLYLALMKHTLGEGFTLAVLDDVLMSVDAGHRREVCSLLKTRFPKTQFILTTHDPVWLQFMRTENLIQGNISFGGWTVESGPQVWTEDDVWKQIDDKLAKSDVRVPPPCFVVTWSTSLPFLPITFMPASSTTPTAITSWAIYGPPSLRLGKLGFRRPRTLRLLGERLRPTSRRCRPTPRRRWRQRSLSDG